MLNARKINLFIGLAFASLLSSCNFQVSNSAVTATKAPTAVLTYCDLYPQINVAPFVTGYTPIPDGSAANPYLICTVGQLSAIQADNSLWNKNYTLKRSLNLTTYSGIIGNNAVKFTGTFDGGGFTLSNFAYNNNATDYVGIFGFVLGDGAINGVNDGVIKNVVVTNANVTGRNNVGALVGYADTAQILDSSSSGTITGGNVASSYTGGVVGGTNVTGGNNLLSGLSSSATVIGVDGVGGVAGGRYGTFTNLTGNGSVTGVNSVGGVLGYLEGCTLSFLTYQGGTVTGTGNYVGGAVGITGVGCNTITDVSTSGTLISGGGGYGGAIGRTNATTLTRIYSSATITNTFGSNLGGLIGYYVTAAVVTVSDCWATGSVTGTIGGQEVGGLIGYVNVGVGSTINNCYATGAVSGGTYVGGLIGRVDQGLAVSNSYATGSVTGVLGVGGLIGRTNDSITNSYATGNVTNTTGNFAGGLVGDNNAGTISNSYASGSVSGVDYTGGLVGAFQNGSVLADSYATGNVTGRDYTGGFGGSVGGTISRSWSSGDVVGRNYTGGFTGREASNAGGLNDCRAFGNVTGQLYTGGLSGTVNSPAVVTRCFSYGSVRATNTYSGGFVGTTDGTITHSASLSKHLTSASGYGGFAGYIDVTGVVDNCYSITKVIGDGSGGGFVGELRGTVRYSFSTGDVTITAGGSGAGGFVYNLNGGTITDSFSTGNVTATTFTVGGFIGTSTNGSVTRCYATGIVSYGACVPCAGFNSTNNGTTYSNNFWNNSGANAALTDIGTGNVAGIDATSSVNMQIQATYTAAGWDWVGEAANGNNDYWVMPTDTNGVGYPRLTNASTNWSRYICYGAALAAAPFAAGAGTVSSPYIICTPTQLAAIGADNTTWDKYFILGQNIDLSGVTWTAPGTSAVPFTGVFEAGPYAISNLDYTGTSDAGLFGYVSGGEIRNVTLINPQVTGTTSVGAIAGRVSAARVVNGNTNGVVSGTSQVGGAIGTVASNSQIRNTGSSATVTGTSTSVGGLVGSNAGTIRYSYSKIGSVSGAGNAGGLIGLNSGAISDNYSHENASGGVVGGLVGANTGTIVRSYSLGVPTGGVVGGLLGQNTSGTITDSFWNVSTSGLGIDGTAVGSAGGTGKNTANMQTQATFTNFDFSRDWAISAASYPRQIWE